MDEITRDLISDLRAHVQRLAAEKHTDRAEERALIVAWIQQYADLMRADSARDLLYGIAAGIRDGSHERRARIVHGR